MFGAFPFGALYYGEAFRQPAIERPLIRSRPTAGTIGCGDYTVFVMTRGGRDLVAAVPATSLSWSRVLDDTSEAQVNVEGAGRECARALRVARPWRHEVAIWRDRELVWVGPLFLPAAGNSFELPARDLTAWWDHRLIHHDYNFTRSTDLATVFQALASDAMAVDNSPGLVLRTTPCGVRGAQKVLANSHQIAGPILRDIAQTGVDWTAVGRTILAGGLVIPTRPIGTFVDEHFVVPPRITLDGSVQANRWIVTGEGGGEEGDAIFGVASDPEAAAADGLLESVESVTTISTDEAATAAAESRVALTTEVVGIDDATLTPYAPVTMSELVPGALCELNLQDTAYPVVGTFRLQAVKVAASGGQEAVTLSFQPPGTE